jgi:opacity protein-like surface antigen
MVLMLRYGLLVVLVLAIAPMCLSQNDPPESAPRSWDFGIWVAGATGKETTNSFTQAQIVTAGFGVEKVITGELGNGWRQGRLAYGGNVIPLFVQLRPGRPYGFAIEPVILRWNSSRHASNWSPYIELAGGGVFTNTNLPAGDTSDFNFTARIGAGLQIHAGNRNAIDLSCRWLHISNANLGRQNPQFNGLQVGIGYHWHR